MAHKNDSSQMRACLRDSDPGSGPARESRGGSSQEKKDSTSPKRNHSESSTDSSQRPAAEARSGGLRDGGELKREPECHMELENLFANKNHTVLIDTKEFRAGKIVPHKETNSRVWDDYHVKLPHFQRSSTKESRWEAIIRALQKLMNGHASVGDVEGSIMAYNQGYRADWSFGSLYNYAERSKQETEFSRVIAKMAALALKLPELIQQPIPLLKQNNSHAITMSQEQISCLLANAFFCTFPHRNTNQPGSEYANFPTINFSSLFADPSPRKFQKLRALFHYFNTVTKAETKPDGLVTFQRISIPPNNCPQWSKSPQHLTKLRVYAEGTIEKEGKGMLQVDFAAKAIGGGVLGHGMVQEEICFLQCPELIVARLFTEKLADNECLKITGAQMYSNTCGYSDNFEWHSPHKDQTRRDKWKRRFCQIVAIDALKFTDAREQYTEKNIKRELFKAFVGFKGDHNIPPDYTPAIATGNWGCGAFKGDPLLKALIQMMAAAEARRDLAYFTFNNTRQAEELQRMHDTLTRRKVTVGKLYSLLQDYSKLYTHNRHKGNVFQYITETMGSQSSNL
ncbi:poly(ADP-ribose) glycohydrolase isoform 2-T2 [Clarias gariepinus]|nr:poly(ADP-ribose) glycohydrolase isoform X2 [Clarias gariepinus]